MSEIVFIRRNGYIEFKSPKTGKKDFIVDSSQIFKITTTKGGLLIHKKRDEKIWTTKCLI